MFHECDGIVSFPLSRIPRSREMRRVINMCDVRERGSHASSSTFPHIVVSCIIHLLRDVYFLFFPLILRGISVYARSWLPRGLYHRIRPTIVWNLKQGHETGSHWNLHCLPGPSLTVVPTKDKFSAVLSLRKYGFLIFYPTTAAVLLAFEIREGLSRYITSFAI